MLGRDHWEEVTMCNWRVWFVGLMPLWCVIGAFVVNHLFR